MKNFSSNSHIKSPISNKFLQIVAISILFLSLVSCGGGGGGGGGSGAGTFKNGFSVRDSNCGGGCGNDFLTTADVETILRQGVSAASAQGAAATFAITDRVGNVLAVYQMSGAVTSVRINGGLGAVGGLEGAVVPASFAAISKAGTGAFLSSQGNAFSTRTASQIIQEHFNPGERNQPGGPLFGVQFSQTICSDVTRLDGGTQGPRPLPLGLSGDPGGISLYKNGDLVGGLGVEIDGIYGLDRNIGDQDDAIDERVALMASRGFEVPAERRAESINVLGKSLRFADLNYEELDALPEELAVLDGARLISVPPFNSGTIRQGTRFGDAGSGVAKTVRAGVPAAILVNGAGAPLYPSRSGAANAGLELGANEVEALLDSALLTASRARAAIRRPHDSIARVSIWVVDHLGNPLGFVRSEDAPVFGIDVALQKARTAAFFSSADAGAKLNAVRGAELGAGVQFEDYAGNARVLLGASSLTGAQAFADRSVGNLARPFFPDGIDSPLHGPFSLPLPGLGNSATGRSWSPFNTGLQFDLIARGLLAPLSGGNPSSCTNQGVLGDRLRNGIQIFPGSVPLYRNGVLIGAIGISGDGVDQDDLVAFYGASRQGLDAVGRATTGDAVLGFNAPKEIRADNIVFSGLGARLRYVNCPEAPFLESDGQNTCEGL